MAASNLMRDLRAGDAATFVAGCHADRFVLKKSSADANYLVDPANQPGFAEWNVQRVNDKNLAPRLDTYAYFMNHVVWPETGAIMRRLDDGKGPSGGKPGNMYVYLGSDDAERAKNLQAIKAWLGDGAWNLNRWEKRGDTPAISKEQLDKIKAKF
jgi:hypothetical protein